MELRELGWANLALTQMQSARDLNEYEKSWVDFLHYLDRAWNKLEKYARAGGSVQKHFSEVNRWRKEDELLRYLVQARNSDEHSIQEIVGKQAGCLTITGGIDGGTIYRGMFEGSGRVGNLLHEGNLEIKFHPERLEVIPVSNRGVTYPPPESHLGSLLKTRLPHELAKIALNYYESNAQLIFGELPEMKGQ
ncbi:MAG: hypothetical protein NT123_05280 [Proteobacteria bacterium]|nr:hypothetical protein [Pseudomonadota bacterium]